MKKTWLIILCCLLVMIVGGAGYYFYQNGIPDNIVKKSPQKRTAKIVAIGDSLTYGVGDEKEHGYVGQIKNKLSKQKNLTVSTHNYGVSGERSDQINKRVTGESEIQHNLKNANIIVMTVGGNDLFQNFQKVLFANSANGAEKQLVGAQLAYEKKLNILMRSVRKYNAHAPIFVFSVYNPFYVYFSNVALINNTVTSWNRTTEKTVNKVNNTHFINVSQTLSDGQYNTPAKRARLLAQNQSANNGKLSLQQIEAIESNQKEVNKYISNVDNFHPNKNGYRKMTSALYKSIRKNIPWIGVD